MSCISDVYAMYSLLKDIPTDKRVSLHDSLLHFRLAWVHIGRLILPGRVMFCTLARHSRAKRIIMIKIIMIILI